MEPTLSVIIPFLNEHGSLRELYRRMNDALASAGSYELVFVDDGSTDGSFDIVEELFRSDERIRVIQLRRNCGKSAAQMVGFHAARGKVIATIDADLQDEPNEIPRMLAALDHADCIVGWKKMRHDPWTKRIPSFFFNATARVLFGVKLHDMNCGLKVMRKEVTDSMELYGELHRFIPVLAAQAGFRVAEIPVEHHERKFGKSKYGWRRFVRGSMDLMTVAFLGRFRNRPLHFFGGVGALLFLLGLLCALYLTVLHFVGQTIGDRPLLLFSALAILVGLQFTFTGLLAELLISRGPERHYPVQSMLDHDRNKN